MTGSKWNIVFIGIIICLLAFIGFNTFFKNDKIAYIDSSKLLEQSKAFKAVQQQMQLEEEKAKSNIDTLMKEFDGSLKSYEKNLSKMSAKESQMAKELLKNKQSQLIQYQQAIKQKVEKEQQQKVQEILKGINAYISEYGKNNGYKMILATSNGNIAYGDESVDITEKIIEGINK